MSLKIPQKPKRWLPDTRARKGQICEWAHKCWVYSWANGKPEKLEKCIDDFLNTFIDVARDLDFGGEPIYESMVKLKAYNYRNMHRYQEALPIFLAGMKKDKHNYHWVEDCLDTYMAMNEGRKAIELLNAQPVEFIATEAHESADYILKLVEDNPTLKPYLKEEILDWARENCKKENSTDE